MKKSYINGMACISAQETTSEKDFFSEKAINFDSVVFKANPADYKKYIPPAAMRRMSQSVKMGIAASAMAMEDAGIEQPDAIITGTGKGCRQDSETFMENMLDHEEQFLTPIKFIQSTHNTVGGQIALGLGCNAYNFTYVQSSVSFESALIDAQLWLGETSDKHHILVGGIDEIAVNSNKLHRLNGHLKKEIVFNNLELFQSDTEGTLESEGAVFFVLSDEKCEKSKAQVLDVGIYNNASPEEMEQHVHLFLKQQGVSEIDVDAVILGNNGDRNFDHYYRHLQEGIFKNTPQLCYKHLIGEYNTASAFAMWLGSTILQRQKIPAMVEFNHLKPEKNIQYLLLYNQYRGRNHSVVLLAGIDI